MSDYKRGHRAECNLIRDPIDNYLDRKDEIDEVIAAFTPQDISKQVNQIFYTSSSCEDDKYVRVAEICKNSKIYCADENELYDIDKRLNELGYKTRVGRNMYTGGLSIAVLEEPNQKGE